MVHQYKLNGYNIVMDTCSGSVHSVDDVAYDIIEMFEDGDYKIALDYEVKKAPTKILNTEILPEFSNYSMRVKFKVRNAINYWRFRFCFCF